MGFEWVEGLKTFRQHSLRGTADPSQGPLAMMRAGCGRQQGRRGREDRCALSQAVGVAGSRPTEHPPRMGDGRPRWGAAGPGSCTSQATGPPDASSAACGAGQVEPGGPPAEGLGRGRLDPRGALTHTRASSTISFSESSRPGTLTWPRQVSAGAPSRGPASQLLLP